jgi:glutaminyl-tRNA synthetase
VEPSLVGIAPETRLQLERHGYFCADAKDHRPDRAVFNRIAGLKDGWGK